MNYDIMPIYANNAYNLLLSCINNENIHFEALSSNRMITSIGLYADCSDISLSYNEDCLYFFFKTNASNTYLPISFIQSCKNSILYVDCDYTCMFKLLGMLSSLFINSEHILAQQYELYLNKKYNNTILNGHHARIHDLKKDISWIFQKKISIKEVEKISINENPANAISDFSPNTKILFTIDNHNIYHGKTTKNQSYSCLIIPVFYFEEIVEFLIIDNYSDQLSEIDRSAIRATISALEIEYEMRRSIFSVINNSRNSLLDSIAISGKLPISTIYEWASLLGLKLNKLYNVIFIDFSSQNNTEEIGQVIYYQVLEFMMYYNHPDDYYFLRSSANNLYMIGQYPNLPDTYIQKKATSMAEQLCKFIIGKQIVSRLHIGIGSTQKEINSISQSYKDSLEAVHMAKTSNKSIITFKQLGILRLLNYIPQSDTLETYIPDFIIILKKYDDEHNSNLIETLSAYYIANCNAAQAAKALFVHYKTFLNRMSKIQQLTKLDFSDSQFRLDAEIGLRILNIFNSDK